MATTPATSYSHKHVEYATTHWFITRIWLVVILSPEGQSTPWPRSVHNMSFGDVRSVWLFPERKFDSQTSCVWLWTQSRGCLFHVLHSVHTHGKCVWHFKLVQLRPNTKWDCDKDTYWMSVRRTVHCYFRRVNLNSISFTLSRQRDDVRAGRWIKSSTVRVCRANAALMRATEVSVDTTWADNWATLRDFRKDCSDELHPFKASHNLGLGEGACRRGFWCRSLTQNFNEPASREKTRIIFWWLISYERFEV